MGGHSSVTGMATHLPRSTAKSAKIGAAFFQAADHNRSYDDYTVLRKFGAETTDTGQQKKTECECVCVLCCGVVEEKWWRGEAMLAGLCACWGQSAEARDMKSVARMARGEKETESDSEATYYGFGNSVLNCRNILIVCQFICCQNIHVYYN